VGAHCTQVVTLVFDRGVQGLADVVGEGGGSGDGWEAGCGDDLGVHRVVVSSCGFLEPSSLAVGCVPLLLRESRH
jgi:hypothetical protein